MKRIEKRSLEARFRRIFIPTVVLLLAGTVAFFHCYTFVDGGVYPLNAKELDLRERHVSISRFERLSAQMPDATIFWNVPIGNKFYDSESEILYVDDLSEEDIPRFAHFDNLRQVNASRCRNYDALLALYEAYPDLDVRWAVELGGKKLSQGCQSLRFNTKDVSAEELLETLARLPELETLVIDGVLTAEDQRALMEAYPAVTFDWDISLCGKTFRSTDKTLSFADLPLTEESIQAIENNLPRFYSVDLLDFRGCGTDSQRMVELREKTGAEVSWNFELCGVTVNSLDTEIDLSGHAMESIRQIEDALPYFSRLERVIMCDCGIPDEEMDALNSKYENIRFVWTVYMGRYRVRTDAKGFICSAQPGNMLDDTEAWKLRYCTDLLALDLGHRPVTDISFVQYMPNLRYLILCCARVSDLSPLAGHPSLESLEITDSITTGLTPLLECPALLDLNLCLTPRGDVEENLEVLCQMKNLERLWYSSYHFSPEQAKQIAEMLPNCQIYTCYGKKNVFGGGWRYHERYYEMRDALDMYYMNPYGIQVRYKIWDGVMYWPGDEGY